MLYKLKTIQHKQYLEQLPKLPQKVEGLNTLFSPEDFRIALINAILHASSRIYITALFLENDDGGRDILNALYLAKRQCPDLKISVLVDWHRAQRGRIGAGCSKTNSDWYCFIAEQYPNISVPIYGIPVNTREALGVFHVKGFIVDNSVIYSGASLNDVYLHRHTQYRYDRYHFIENAFLANSMSIYIEDKLLTNPAVHRLDRKDRPKSSKIRHKIRQFRHILRSCAYTVPSLASNNELALTPITGLGRHSLLNKTIHNLMRSAVDKVTLCTPYFNMPSLLVRNIIFLLRQNKQVEIIVGDKKANDFYIPESEPFNIIGTLPYFYEMNLRHFIMRLQRFIDNGQLIVRIWKCDQHTFHVKGIWVDHEWQLITGSNLNPRAWLLDLENAVLIHDPKHQLDNQFQKERGYIQTNTDIIRSYYDIDTIYQYPKKVRKLIKRVSRIRIDLIIRRIL
ncbi:CDP-diacylglycerol--serine O-phosphatidyltransferase [Candidatus Profftia tarda]|uniref:CDP-diacylglycerol--serine O-phosphatidyltransferase n=1 Tax=Candidatus Profftia tarda TaxID=1177216 RepID=UPI001C1F2C5C|nr:CDP-diacylglycerol--serine O-phosphatidyltransferase [Candidatus Profftia tarda]